MPFEPVLIIPILALCIPIVAIIASFRHRTEEMRLKAGVQGSSNLLSELQDLKNQLAEMRDTTTRYDVSFDSALQRIESRVGNIENRVTTVEEQVNSVKMHSRTTG